jgi:hypothetical protein
VNHPSYEEKSDQNPLPTFHERLTHCILRISWKQQNYRKNREPFHLSKSIGSSIVAKKRWEFFPTILGSMEECKEKSLYVRDKERRWPNPLREDLG